MAPMNRVKGAAKDADFHEVGAGRDVRKDEA
jgi:hypothetical protein